MEKDTLTTTQDVQSHHAKPDHGLGYSMALSAIVMLFIFMLFYMGLTRLVNLWTRKYHKPKDENE